MTLTTSVFKFQQTNLAVPNPSDFTGLSSFFVPGLASRGFEFEAQGKVSG